MLDKTIVDQYDPEVFKEALGIFIPDSTEVLSKIDNSKDHETLTSWAHRIKGSYLMIGAKGVADLALLIERSQSFEEGKSHVAELKSAHERLLSFLKTSYQIEG